MAARSRLTLDRARVSLVCAAAVLALSACGDSGDGDADRAKGDKGVVTKLSPAQFEALDRANALESCTVLDARDPLLGPLRRSCQEFTGVESATFGAAGCPSAAACSRVFRNVAGKAREARATGRATDRTVDATGLPDSCKRALLTPPSLFSALRDLEVAMRDAAPRVAAGSPEDALVELAGMAKIRDQLPDRDKLLAQLRGACRG